MKLTELDPQWIMRDGVRLGFTFICPTNPKFRMSCFPNPLSVSDQIDMFDAAHGENRMVAPSNPDENWQIAGGIEIATFETMTVTPSLDGSNGGLCCQKLT